MTIPRVRLTYVEGLAPLHEELKRPREVDVITDGQALIVCPPATRRPLARLPLGGITEATLASNVGPAGEHAKAAAGLSGAEDAIVLVLGAGRDVPPGVAGKPVVFVDPQDRAADKLRAVQNVLVPRTAEQMARLEKGERMRGRYYAVGFIGAVAFLLLVLVPLFLIFFGPRPRGQQAPPTEGPAVPVLVAPIDVSAWLPTAV